MQLLSVGGVRPLYSGAQTTRADAFMIKSDSEFVSGTASGFFSVRGVYKGQSNSVRSITSALKFLLVNVSLNALASARFLPDDADKMRTLSTMPSPAN